MKLTAPQQVRAASGLPRSKILALLVDHQSCATEMAKELSMNKGTVAYHLRVLLKAGLVRVAFTRQVRAVTERYYARAARSFVVEPTSASGDTGMAVIREFLAEYGGQLGGAGHTAPAITNFRLPAERVAEFLSRFTGLLAEFVGTETVDSHSEPVGVIVGAYRLTAFNPSDGMDHWLPAPCLHGD
jgi:DNA-binding transcriptional ArsR family regulator